jgi:uncharacterized protein (DUF58 family)
MIFFIIFLVLLAIVFQQLTVRKGLDGLEESHRSSADIMEPDEKFDIIVSLTNRSRTFIPFIRYKERLNPEFEVYVDKENVYVDGRGETYVVGTTWLKPHQTVEKRIPVSISKRGRYLLRELTVYGGDFLGVNEFMRSSNRLNEIIIYPKEAPSTQIDKVFGGFLGDVSVSRFIFEDPVLTLGFREYTGREPMKMISWVQSARSGDLMVKKYDYTLEPTVSVALNIESKLENRDELIEKCYSLARTVCKKLEDQGIKYDFRMNPIMVGSMSARCYVSEGLGRRHFYGILESLGRATYDPIYTWRELLEMTVRNSGSGHGIIFITPGGDGQIENTAKVMADKSGGTLMILTAKEMGI